MRSEICEAIKNKRRITFEYNGRLRLTEPQCYGMGHKGTELLRVYQVNGGAEQEPLFNLSKATNLTVLNDHFISPGPNYKKGDSAMKVIYCEL